MRLKKNRYQFGSLERRKRTRGPDLWLFRWYENGVHLSEQVGTTAEFKNESQVRKSSKVQSLLLKINKDAPKRQIVQFGTVLELYRQEIQNLRDCTRQTYEMWIRNYIQPRWEAYPVHEMLPLEIEKWLTALDLAGKSKAHIRSLMHSIFELAQKNGLTPIERNIMELVKVKGGTKRQRVPRIIQPAQIKLLADALEEDHAETEYAFLPAAILTAGGTGIRRGELFGLKWRNVVIEELLLQIRQTVVDGVIGETKTEASAADVPLDPVLAEVLLRWKAKSKFTKPEDWVFASPWSAGELPYSPNHMLHSIIIPKAKQLGIGVIGWHTFRHTFRAMMNQLGTPVGIQQELMRHADVRTTTKEYGKAIGDAHRDASSKVFRMVTAGKEEN